MAATPYSKLLAAVAVGDGVANLDVPDDWLQGRTLFGGLQVAIALAAMRTVAPAAPLRTLQATFLSPVPGGPVRAKARVLRSGKNATHVEGRIVGATDETLALVIGVFGPARESAVQLHPRQPAVTEGAGAFELPFVAGTTPNFTQHFRARWLTGGAPFTGSTNPENVIALGMHDGGHATEAHVVAMADFIPPIALSYLKVRVAAASLTWMLELLVDDVSTLPLDGWRVDATMEAAGGGYSTQSLLLWGPGGVPVALGRQSMVVFG
jgi:acyl-coenzyme A thioesterase PaaI-like protein